MCSAPTESPQNTTPPLQRKQSYVLQSQLLREQKYYIANVSFFLITQDVHIARNGQGQFLHTEFIYRK